MIEEDMQRILTLILHKMTNPKTFFLSIDPEPERDNGQYCGCYDAEFSEDFVRNVIKFLPPTCINLEIDTGGAKTGCFCDELRGLLPQLHQLRVHTRSLCRRLLFVSNDYAKTAPVAEKVQSQLLSQKLRTLVISSVICPGDRRKEGGGAGEEDQIFGWWIVMIG